MGDITKNFNYQEFLVSKDYPEVAKNMKLTLCEKQVIKLLCEAILQPLRNRFGATANTKSTYGGFMYEVMKSNESNEK